MGLLAIFYAKKFFPEKSAIENLTKFLTGNADISEMKIKE
jgi:hypothetical protein